jgi:hypothetical protein
MMARKTRGLSVDIRGIELPKGKRVYVLLAADEADAHSLHYSFKKDGIKTIDSFP